MALSAPIRPAFSSSRSVGGGQPYLDVQAAFGVVVQRQPAMVLAHDARHDGQAQPRALRAARLVAALEGLQQLVGAGRVDAVAVIAAAEQQALAILRGADEASPRLQ